MNKDDKVELFEKFKDGDSDEAEFVVERGTIQDGRTFSREALQALSDNMIVFVGARVFRKWGDRNVPPTRLKVTVKVEVQ